MTGALFLVLTYAGVEAIVSSRDEHRRIAAAVPAVERLVAAVGKIGEWSYTVRKSKKSDGSVKTEYIAPERARRAARQLRNAVSSARTFLAESPESVGVLVAFENVEANLDDTLYVIDRMNAVENEHNWQRDLRETRSQLPSLTAGAIREAEAFLGRHRRSERSS